MKLTALLMISSFLGLDPNGCGAGLGANEANGPGDDTTADGGAGSGTGTGTGTTGSDAGTNAPTQMTCGTLGTHFFCDDFSSTALPGAWDAQEVSAGTVTLDNAQTVSAPNALFSKTLHLTTGTRSMARVSKKFAHASSHFKLAYAQRVDASCIGSTDAVETGALALKSNTYWLSIRYGTPDAILEATVNNGFYAQAHQLKQQMPRGQWVHVTLDVDVSTNMLGLEVDGQTIVKDEPLKYPPGANQAPMILVGSLVDNLFGPSACEMRIDDVTLDVGP